MESSRAVLLTLMCVLFARISGAEVKMWVRRGDNITLYCDCFISLRSEIAWFRNCSDENHPPLALNSSSNFKQHFPGHAFVRNSSSKSYDLFIKNVTEKDLGLYYCARQEKHLTSEEKGLKRERTVYGGLATRIILRDTTFPCADRPQTTPTRPASDCSVCWKLLWGRTVTSVRVKQMRIVKPEKRKRLEEMMCVMLRWISRAEDRNG
ncbi:hypothetical protein SRHO_G00248320 [Serrasalmus rhombeus]